MHYLVLDMVEYLVESAAYEPESVCTTIRGGSEFVARVYEGLHARGFKFVTLGALGS